MPKATAWNFAPLPDMGQPYGAIAAKDLKEQRNYPMMYHHVVSKTTLSKLWRDTVANTTISETARFYLKHMQAHAAQYTAMIRPPGDIHPTDVAKCAELAEGLWRGTLVHAPDGKRLDAFDAFWTFYMWLPGNLFEGPRNRADDPKDAIDANAIRIVGTTQYTLLADLQTAIDAYGQTPKDQTRAKTAWEAMRKMAASDYRKPRPFNAKHWTWVSGENGPRIDQG
ncbi:hypothetical protein [Embleya sp. NPDC005971]|uniref:hypothetical protein n=1 Tax=Embleya sp. NPDC005971 TaxID=3156724 RepID=UPI00340AB5E2